MRATRCFLQVFDQPIFVLRRSPEVTRKNCVLLGGSKLRGTEVTVSQISCRGQALSISGSAITPCYTLFAICSLIIYNPTKIHFCLKLSTSFAYLRCASIHKRFSQFTKHYTTLYNTDSVSIIRKKPRHNQFWLR